MDSGTIKNLAIAVMALTVSIVAVQTSRSISQLSPEITQSAKQIKLASFDVQAAAKALKQETTDPEAIDERRRVSQSTNVVLGQTARAVEQLNNRTLPALTVTLNTADLLIRNTDRQLNTALLPEMSRATRNLANLAEAFQVEQS